jgi:PPOX class probable FMN-dependent enzyme
MNLRSHDDLRSLYRQPGRGPIDKVIQRLDEHCGEFLSKSPFFVLSTASGEGICDASPKGGPPGFTEVLNESQLAWADYSGNNRLDSFENIVNNDSVGLLFLIPGLDEMLRINGTAELSTSKELCERFTVGTKSARVVVVVTVVEAYIHCAKALRRSDLWTTSSWLEPKDLPSAARIVRDHAASDRDVSLIEKARLKDIEDTIWEPGGQK